MTQILHLSNPEQDHPFSTSSNFFFILLSCCLNIYVYIYLYVCIYIPWVFGIGSLDEWKISSRWKYLFFYFFFLLGVFMGENWYCWWWKATLWQRLNQKVNLVYFHFTLFDFIVHRGESIVGQPNKLKGKIEEIALDRVCCLHTSFALPFTPDCAHYLNPIHMLFTCTLIRTKVLVLHISFKFSSTTGFIVCQYSNDRDDVLILC